MQRERSKRNTRGGVSPTSPRARHFGSGQLRGTFNPVRRKGFKLTASRRFRQEAFSFPRCASKFPHEPRPQFGATLPWPIVTLLRRNGFQATKGCRNLALSVANCALSNFLKAEAAPAESDCVAREGIFARRAKTNLPMCLRRCESSSLGRFAERVRSCLRFTAAEVPCKTAPFASFSGRMEKDGPARPERISMSSSLVKAIKKEA